MQVDEFLERSANRCPEKVALVCGSRRLTYAEIEALSNQMARAMIERGLQRWDRVAVYANNSAESVLAIFAILKAGGIFLLVNPTTKQDKLT
jgi:long-chain acyl-CoA synthetase